MAAKWASVRFEDKTVKKVPVSYFKDYKRIEIITGNKYPVFWSPKEEETPDDVRLNQGIIHEIEKLPETKSRTDKEPLPGYYTACVLEIAKSVKELMQDKAGRTTTKRVSVLTEKMVDLKKQQRSKGNASKKLSIQEPDSPYKSKAKKKEVIKQGTKSTNDDLLSKYKKKSKKNPSPNVSTDSDSSSSDIIERRELKDVQRRKDVLEKQNSTMRAELCELRSLNRKWQTKFFEIEEGDLSQPDKPTVVRSLISDFGDQSATPEKVSPGAERKLLPTNLVSKCFSSDLERIEYEEEEGEAEKLPSLHATPEKKTDEEQPSVETPVGNFQVVKSPVKIKPHSATTVSSCAFDVNPSASTSTVTASSKKASKEKKKKKVSLPALDEDPADAKLVQARIPLSPKKLAKAEYGIRGKAKGDSVYVRNLAMSIFSPEVLIRSSVTGTGCTAKEDSIPRPPLPQIGMEYLSACFDERAKKEIPAPDKDTLDMRRKQINQILAHKIKEERKKYFD